MKRLLPLAAAALIPLAGPAAAQLRPEPSLPLPSSILEPLQPAVVREGDTLPSLAERYGLSVHDLLVLNPGLQLPLRPGTPIRVSAVGPRRRFDQSLDELVLQGVVTPVERNLARITPGAFEQACRGGALSPRECRDGTPLHWGPRPAQTKHPSPREQLLLDRIRASKAPVDQWRRFGQCSYDWGNWKLHSNGIRTTGVDCGGTAMRWQIGVSCDRLVVSIRSRDGVWGSWEPPAGAKDRFRSGEELMVASLCANALTAPAAAVVKP